MTLTHSPDFFLEQCQLLQLEIVFDRADLQLASCQLFASLLQLAVEFADLLLALALERRLVTRL